MALLNTFTTVLMSGTIMITGLGGVAPEQAPHLLDRGSVANQIEANKISKIINIDGTLAKKQVEKSLLTSTTHQMVVTASANVKLDFDKPTVSSKPKPKPKPPVVVEAQSATVANLNESTQSLTSSNGLNGTLKSATVSQTPKEFIPRSGVKANFDTAKAVAAAQSEVGKSFATGWSAPGECIVAARRWVLAGGGNWSGGGTPIGNYVTATEVNYADAAAGDVIQYVSNSNPNAWVGGVHTVLVVGNNGDGTLSIIEANNPGGSGLVSANHSWTPTPPSGLSAKVFRF